MEDFMKIKQMFLCALLAGFATNALADQTYVLTKKNKIQFISKITGGSFDTKSTSAEGTITMDDTGQKLISASISVPVKSLDTGLSMRNEHMQKKYLEVAKFPDITFTIKEANSDLKPETTVRGNFSIHGVQKEVEIPVTTSTNEKNITIKSQFPINILDYGIEQPKFAVVKMEPDVQLSIELSFEKK